MLRAAEEFDYDIYLSVGSVPAGQVAPALAYRDLPPEVRITQQIEEQDGGVLVKRRFETPAGPLSDEVLLPPAGREYGISPSPVWHERIIKEPADLDRVRYMLPDPTRVSTHRYHQAARLIGDRGLAEITLYPPLDHFIGDLRGLTELMMDYYLDRPFFERMFAFAEEYALAVLKSLLEQGVTNILGSWYYASLSAGWSPAIFHEVFFPCLRDHAALVHQYGGIYHIYDDGKMMRTLPEYVAAGADVVDTLTPPPVGDVDLAAAKRLYGRQTCLKGYIDLLYVIKEGTPELIERTVREAIEVAAPGGGFILGTSDSIRDGTPLENVLAYYAAAHKYGRYT